MSIKEEWMFEIAPKFFNPENIKDISIKRDLMKIERRMVEAEKKAKNELEVKNAKEKVLMVKDKKKKKKKRFVFS